MPVTRVATSSIRAGQTPWLAAKHSVDSANELRKGHRVVRGIERGLIPSEAELHCLFKGRMAPIFLSFKPIPAVMVEIEIAFENTVLRDNPVRIGLHVRPQNRSGQLRMIVSGECVANI